jgi:uncharacterized protein (DUF1330 family)
MPIKPTGAQIKTLLEADQDRPVVMLNLLRYAPKAAGEAGERGLSGAESYRRYGEEVSAMLAAVGAKLLWRGRADSVVIGEPDEQWDEVLLVEYPSRRAFIQMTSRKDYEKTGEHRTSALIDSRLIATTELFRDFGAPGEPHA